jgi:hypothetical protein
MSSSSVDPIIINGSDNKSGTNSIITVRFPTPVSFFNKQMALGYLGLYYSWRNVSGQYTTSGKKGYNNNSFGYYWTDGILYNVTLPDGFYSISDLNGYLQFAMNQNGHYVLDATSTKLYFISFTVNPVYYSVTVRCNPVVVPIGGLSTLPAIQLNKTPQLYIPTNNFGSLVGFNSGSYPPTANTTLAYFLNSQNVPKISPVTTVLVNCNLTLARSSNNINTIYQFSPTVSYASYITIQPPYLTFFNMVDGSVPSLTLSFTDQDGNLLDIIDPQITATVLVREKI